MQQIGEPNSYQGDSKLIGLKRDIFDCKLCFLSSIIYGELHVWSYRMIAIS